MRWTYCTYAYASIALHLHSCLPSIHWPPCVRPPRNAVATEGACNAVPQGTVGWVRAKIHPRTTSRWDTQIKQAHTNLLLTGHRRQKSCSQTKTFPLRAVLTEDCRCSRTALTGPSLWAWRRRSESAESRTLGRRKQFDLFLRNAWSEVSARTVKGESMSSDMASVICLS